MSAHGGFRHAALMYSDREEFLEGTSSFIREGVEADEATLVVLGAEKIDMLRSKLGEDADRVAFADMAEVGANPARLIPAWRDYIAEHSRLDRPIRGIGEPIWPGRSAAELVECQRHESLLNLAFGQTPGLSFLCPYDTKVLGPEIIDEARRSHPYIAGDGAHSVSGCCRDLEAVAAPFDAPLPEPPVEAPELRFQKSTLTNVRMLTTEHGAQAGLPPLKVDDLVLAANEVATNSVLHAGGEGVLRVWEDADAVICEVRDRGHIDDPLVGRERPVPGGFSGHGMWMVNQLCDLVQVRTFPTGNVVRLHMRRD